MGKWLLAAVVFVIAAILGVFVANWFRGGDTVIVNLDSTQVTPGWKRHEVKSANFRIDLPVEFTGLDPQDPQLGEAIKAVAKRNPDAEKLLLQVMGKSHFVFWAFDFENMTGGFAKNVNAIREIKQSDLPEPGSDVSRFRDAIARSLPRNGKLVGIAALKLPAGNALFTEMEFDIQNERGKLTTRSFGYGLLDGDSQLTLTFTCLAKDASAFKPIADRAMETLRLLN